MIFFSYDVKDMFVPLTYLATVAKLCCSVISSSLLAKTVHLNLVDLLVV